MKSLNWRSALKTFKPIAPEQVDIKSILNAARMAPSSFGVQPFNIHVVVNPELKKQLREVSYNQPQVTECSHLMIFCARNDASPTVERFIKSKDLDNIAPDYARSMRLSLSSMDKDSFGSFASNQAYLALGFALVAAAELRIGSCPMSGFLPDDVHRVMKMQPNERPVAYMAVGSHLDTEQVDPNRLKLRLDLDDFVQFHR